MGGSEGEVRKQHFTPAIISAESSKYGVPPRSRAGSLRPPNPGPSRADVRPPPGQGVRAPLVQAGCVAHVLIIETKLSRFHLTKPEGSLDPVAPTGGRVAGESRVNGKPAGRLEPAASDAGATRGDEGREGPTAMAAHSARKSRCRGTSQTSRATHRFLDSGALRARRTIKARLGNEREF